MTINRSTLGTAGLPWSDDENDIIVADYFSMLVDDLIGKPYNKANHNRNLQQITGRTHGSIEYKHRNISAILKSLGESWISGYKPAGNFQLPLVDAIERWFKSNPNFWNSVAYDSLTNNSLLPTTFNIDPPPIVKQDTLKDFEHVLPAQISIKFNISERIERNRTLGRAGEECVLAREQSYLQLVGRPDLAKRVKWVSEEIGDGAGYDIKSFTPDGKLRLIEVKTTVGWERTPFYITRNELAVAGERPEEWRLLRLWNFARQPKAFELQPPLENHVNLNATNFEAEFI